MGGSTSYSFERLADFLQQFGFLDFILPFILVFTIVFAVLRKTKIMGDHRNFDTIVSLVIALLFVVPHLLGYSPLGYDPVQVLNETLPSVALVAVAIIMLLILMGIFGADFAKGAAPLLALLAIVFIVYIFGAALQLWNGPWSLFSWWTPEITELLVIIIVFGLIVYFIVREPHKTEGKKLFDWAKHFVEKKF